MQTADRHGQVRGLLAGWAWALRCAAFAIGATFLFGAGPASGQTPRQAANAGFRVRIIEGSKAPAAKVDARLGDLRRELESLHHDYNVFSLVSDQAVRLTIGQRNATRLPDGSEMAIQLLEIVAGPPLRVRHQFELPKSRSVRAVAPGGRTLDVRPWADKLVIICTSVEK